MATLESTLSPQHGSNSNFSFSCAATPEEVMQQYSIINQPVPAFLPEHSSPNGSDKENSQTGPPQIFQSVSANKKTVIVEDTSGDNPVSFTPQRTKAIPRAWERRPATPHVPRRDGDKIWKRVILGELAPDSGVDPSSMSKKDKSSKEDYMKVTKKMKVDSDHSEPSHLGTKVEEENIERGGSPKKKSRTRSENSEAVFHILAGLVTEDMEDRNKAVRMTLAQDAAQFFTDHTGSMAEVLIPVEAERINEDLHGQNTANLDQGNAVREDGNTDNFINEAGVADDGALTHSSTITEKNFPDEEISDQKETVHKNDAETVEISEEIVQTIDTILSHNTDLGSPLVISESSPKVNKILEQSADHPESTSDSNMIETIQNLNTQQDLSSVQPDLESQTVSEQTTVDSAATLKEIHQSNSIEKQQTAAESLVETASEIPQTPVEMPVATRSMTTFVGTEHDETAFLHDFILRARASKAAREATTSSAGLVCDAIEDEQNLVKIFVSNASPETNSAVDGGLNSITNDTKRPEPESNIDVLSSPVRRSNRTANRNTTRLPRPQSLPPVPQFGPVLPSQTTILPPTIQLKRATGTEFIFTAKTAQTLAMTTRSNTKRNQAGAVNVMTRLAQIKAEQIEDVSDEVEPMPTTPHKKAQRLVDGESPSKARKRKRVKDDNGARKAKKFVQWHESLTSYQAISPRIPYTHPTSADFAAIEAAAQAEVIQALKDNSEPTLTTSSEELTLKFDQQPKTEALDDRSGSEASKLKVRKIRKFNNGSVNGTPAPKTRSRTTQLTLESGPGLNTILSTPSSIPKMSSSAIPLPKALVDTSSSCSSSTKKSIITTTPTVSKGRETKPTENKEVGSNDHGPGDLAESNERITTETSDISRTKSLKKSIGRQGLRGRN